MIFNKPKRPVTKTFIHCSDSDYPQHDNVETIRQWHTSKDPRDPSKPWRDIGYHFVITKDGQVHAGRDLELIPAAQAGHNTGTIAICVTGKKEFSDAQRDGLVEFCEEISSAYRGAMTFHGHCEVDPGRTCPNFDYKEWLMLEPDGRLKFF